jgi:PhnB protein
MRVEPYLMLSGRCEEALNFYQSAVGAQPVMTMRFSDSPEPHTVQLPPNWDNKIMHCGFMIGQTMVMATDGWRTDPADFSAVTLSITADSEAQAKQMFEALSKDGKVTMPMSATFWSPCFGMCVDLFGVNWMVGVDGPQA